MTVLNAIRNEKRSRLDYSHRRTSIITPKVVEERRKKDHLARVMDHIKRMKKSSSYSKEQFLSPDLQEMLH